MCLCVVWSDQEVDETEKQVARCKPEGLDALCRTTKFSRKELQIMYRGFKNVTHCLYCSHCTIIISLTVSDFYPHQVAELIFLKNQTPHCLIVVLWKMEIPDL